MSEGKQGTVLLEKVQPSKTNPRRHFDAARQQELTASVVKHGVMTPILVRPSNGHYEIVAGERRFRAAKAAGLTEIPAVIRELSDADALELQMVENLQRDDLHPLEEAEGYRQLLQLKPPTGQKPYDAAKIAERVGRSVKYVYDRIKLLALIEPIRKVFLEGRITAGHAILLARLTPPEQQRAFGNPARNDNGGLWQDASTMFDKERDGKDPLSGSKAVSVRELEEWITENVRFDAGKADAFLFPETVQTVKQAKEKAEKIVAITQEHYIQSEARDPHQRTIVPTSWERADGKKGSKTCDRSVIGVVVVGEGRGDAFRVCINKEKCKVHWGQWQKERVARAKGAAKEGGTAEQRYKQQEERRKAEEAKREAQRKRWEQARPAILTAIAAAVNKAPTKATGLLAQLICEEVKPGWASKSCKPAEYVPRGTSAEDLVRHAVFLILVDEIFEWNAIEEFPNRAKAFGIDVQQILNEVAPVQTSAATAKKK